MVCFEVSNLHHNLVNDRVLLTCEFNPQMSAGEIQFQLREIFWCALSFVLSDAWKTCVPRR